MAVVIERKVWLSFKNGKGSLVPDSLLEKHNDVEFLRLRPTNQVLLMLLYGEHPPKNGSISSSSALKKLLKLRNEAIENKDKEEAEPNPPPEALFGEGEAKQPAKKRKIKKPLDEERV